MLSIVLRRTVSSRETRMAEQCARKFNENSESRFAPIGDDIEPVGESRAGVEMGNEEDEDPLQAEIPRVRMNPKNPTSREQQEHEDIQDMLSTGVGVLLGVEGRGVGGQHRIELLEEEERERTTPIVVFDYGFLTRFQF